MISKGMNIMSDNNFNNKKRIVVKVGSSTITHDETGGIDYVKLEKLVRILCDLKNKGMDVCLVSSGAIAVGRASLGIKDKPRQLSTRQALASIGQAALITIYQKIFAEYNQRIGQVLLTKNNMTDDENRTNAQNTFMSLFDMGIIPIINENDTVSTYEMQFGDNDTLSAIVASIVGADGLILLSDIDGLYTSNPRENADAKLIPVVDELTDEVMAMGSGATGSSVGTGGMATKLKAAQIASASGCDMIIINGDDMDNLAAIFENDIRGTLFKAKGTNDAKTIEIIKEILE